MHSIVLTEAGELWTWGQPLTTWMCARTAFTRLTQRSRATARPISNDHSVDVASLSLSLRRTSIDSNVYAKQRLPQKVEGATGWVT